MPAENFIPLIVILGFFGGFAAVLTFGDLTWQPRPPKQH
jgi:hypothetical protein